MPTSSRIIGAEDLAEVRPFSLADIGASAGAPHAPSEDDLYAGDPAYEAGKRRGLREGFRQGAEAARTQAARDQLNQRDAAAQMLGARATQLAASLTEQFAALEQSVADELVDLAIELARQTVRKAIATDRDAIVTVVQEAVSALLDERSSFTVHLNPGDLEHVDAALGPAFAARHGRLCADASIARGGCRVLSPGAEIDATVGTRWQRVLASIGRAGAPVESTGDA